MKIIFGILYLMFGAAWTFVALWGGNIGTSAAGMAALNFLASWGMFFGGGIALRVVHVALGSLIVLICVAAMVDLALHLTGYLHWIDTGGMMGYLEIFIGGILVLPVIAYVVDFTKWLGERRSRHGVGSASIATNAPTHSRATTERPGTPNRGGRDGTWHRLHVTIGGVTLLLWAICWYFVVLHYFALVKSLGPFSPGVVEIVASILTIPAILYVVAYVRSRPASPAAPVPVPGHSEETTNDESTSLRLGAIAVSPSVHRGIWRVGFILLVLLIVTVALRALVGDDIMCHQGKASACMAVAATDVKLKLWDESPCRLDSDWSYAEKERICRAVAKRYVDRGEFERALEIHDELWKRNKKALLGADTNGVDGNWQARNELLIRLHATPRIDATAEEVCGATTYQRFYCESLIVALQRARYVDSMDKTSQLACSSRPEPECRLYGNWLINTGHKAAGVDVLRTTCQDGEAYSCTSMGAALASGRDTNYAEARWALRRACELKSSTCSEYLRVEHLFVSDDEVRADARDVCRRFPTECIAASRIIDGYLRDSVGARRILTQMCEQSPDLKEPACNPRPAPPPAVEVRAPLSLSPPPIRFKFSEGGNVVTQIVWSDGVLNLRSLGGFGPQQGKVFEDRRVVPTANAWKALDAELRTLGVWSWPPVIDPKNTSMDGVAWTFTVTTSARSFSSTGYNVFPEHYREVVAALKKLAEGASDAPPLQRIGR